MCDFAVVFHPADAAGHLKCLILQAGADYGSAMFSTGMRMAEGFYFLNFGIQAQVLLGRSTRGTCSVLTALNVSFVVIKWSQNEDKSRLSPKALQGWFHKGQKFIYPRPLPP